MSASRAQLADGELSSDEGALVRRIADREDEIVGLACELIGYDTTSRTDPNEPAVDALKQMAKRRCETNGAAEPARGTRCSIPDLVPVRLTADAGWEVTIPDQARLRLAALILPHMADANGWTSDVTQEDETYLRRWCDADPWLAEHPPRFTWYLPTNPRETSVDADNVQALLGANRALGLPSRLDRSRDPA